MEAAHPPERRIVVGDVLREAFSIYGENAGALLGGAVLVFVVVGLVSGLLRNSGGFLALVVTIIVQAIGSAIFTGFVVGLVQDVRGGRRDHTVGDLFSAAAPAIGPLIAFGILAGIGIGIGLVLLIVPGLILLTIWSVGAPAIVVEKVGAMEAFGRSRRLVSGDGWAVFGVLVVTFVIVIVIQTILGAIFDSFGSGAAAAVIAAIVSGVLTAPIPALAASVLFFDLGGGLAVAEVAPPQAAL